MNTANLKTALVALIILVALMFSTDLVADCDMMAMLAKKSKCISDLDIFGGSWNDPDDFIQFVKTRSSDVLNHDGYGVLYYTDNGEFYLDPNNLGHSSTQTGDPDNQAWYQIGFETYYTDPPAGYEEWQWELNTATTQLIDNQNTLATCVLGHARLGEIGVGNHPFRLEIENDSGKVYTFIHNGTIKFNYKSLIFNYLNSLNWFDWTNGYHPNWIEYNSGWYTQGNPNYHDINDIIDSEVLFHWIMYNINEVNGDILQGIRNAITATIGTQNLFTVLFNNPDTSAPWENVANFILSDGENLYVYRNSLNNDPGHKIGFRNHTEFYSVNTQDNGQTLLAQHDLKYITRYDDYTLSSINAAHWEDDLVSGEISTNTTWNTPKYITGNLTVADNVTLNINSHVYILTQCEFNIEGTVNLNDGAQLDIKYMSDVVVEDSGLLFLDWGSTITGFSAGYYSGETYIPGDRIIAQNGGVITTDDDYLNPGDPIIISSNSDELWDGIYIKNPDDEEEFWFVNCNISGIGNLSIEKTAESEDVVANLNLYSTDFTDAGQIVARHGHNLNIEGSNAFVPCNISNNHLTPIVAYDSPVFIQYALIEENGRDENGVLLKTSCDGIYLNYASGAQSYIANSVIQNNTGCGISTYYEDVQIDNCTIQTNEQHGILTKDGTFNNFQNTTVLNNDCAEYVGCQDSYNWPNESNTIQDLDGNSGGYDQYILMAYKWDELEESIWVYGNTINYVGNTTRFYPRYEAFKFEADRSTTPEAVILQTALEDMRNGNYSIAESGFLEIIFQYPDSFEAAVAIRGLLFIESYTEQDYASLIDYIDNIQICEDSPLYKAKEDVKTKSYMKEKEFENAIVRLENIINTSQYPDEVIMAMIDQGYCYMELATLGNRSLPSNCTIKTNTFASYQAKVRELETQLSYYPQQENQNNLPESGNILSATNYPNPFNPTTTISFNLATNDLVFVSVFNIKGQMVKELVKDQLTAGNHTIEWNGKDSNNKSVASGIYFYKISTSKDNDMGKMLLLK